MEEIKIIRTIVYSDGEIKSEELNDTAKIEKEYLQMYINSYANIYEGIFKEEAKIIKYSCGIIVEFDEKTNYPYKTIVYTLS